MLLHRGRNRDENASKLPGPAFMNVEQVGQQPFANNATRNSSPLRFLLSSPIAQPSKIKDSQDTWTADFLTDLRSNRPARPSGARPLPVRHSHTTPIPTLEPPARTASSLSRPSYSITQPEQVLCYPQERPSSSLSHFRAKSALSMREQIGRPLVQQPVAEIDDITVASPLHSSETESKKTPDPVPYGAYMERGQRWMEKQEARSLRVALEDMDLREEQRLHTAAQKEATDIVWKYSNAGVPYRNPGGPRDYKQHLRKGSHARTQSIGRYGVLGGINSISGMATRSASDGSASTRSGGDSSERSRVSSGASLGHKKAVGVETEDIASKSIMEWDSPENKSHTSLTFPMPPTKMFNRRRSSGSRTRATGLDGRPSLFRNPEDQIYEEPEEFVPQISSEDTIIAEIEPLKPKNRNPSISVREQTNTISKSTSVPILEDKTLSRYEIHKNPPSRSRDPFYLRNPLPPASPDSADLVHGDIGMNRSPVKDGVEIRSNEIRAATSMRLKDRSPKLPIPTVVSDRPGRPIVSFDRDYKPREVDLTEESSFSERPSSRNGMTQSGPNLAVKPQLPASINSAPVIPTINILESANHEVHSQPCVPTISFPDVPSISISESEHPTIVTTNAVSSGRPLPRPTDRGRTAHGHRPAPHHSSTAPVAVTKSHWTPISQRATAQCAACALPISGRIVSAASKRFHPECFNCFQCGELLECVAFYPEPNDFRSSRLDRINARLNNTPLPDHDRNHTEEDDGDDGLRFYCHLDFHEKFSPRCRSCKTPIEGEVVIACGGEWHVGHFFCAECGDPFDASTPFVEKDGFAWCVDCHNRRFSGKCAGCRKPITDMVVKALGKEWHEKCFSCKECGGKFEDGRFFTREGSEKPVCVKCEETRLKA